MKISQKSSILGIAGPRSRSWRDFEIFLHFTAIRTIRSHNSTLVQARKLILSIYVYLIIIYKFYKHHHAWMILRIPSEC